MCRLRCNWPLYIVEFHSKDAGYTAYQLVWGGLKLTVSSLAISVRSDHPDDYEVIAEIIGTKFPNTDMQQQNALTLGMSMIFSYEECDHIDWAELIEEAQKAEDKTAYGG